MTPLIPGSDSDGTLPSGYSASGRFRAHGRTEVWAEGAIVHVVASGPFNVEAVDEFSLKMVALYRDLPADRRFVNLSEMRGSIVATPEAWACFAGHLQRVNDSGLPLVGTAWIVAQGVEGRSLFLPRVAALFRRFDRVFASFDSMDAAEAWAREKIAY